MPLVILIALALISLIAFSAAVVTTARATSRNGAGAPASFTYRAYGA